MLSMPTAYCAMIFSLGAARITASVTGSATIVIKASASAASAASSSSFGA